MTSIEMIYQSNTEVFLAISIAIVLALAVRPREVGKIAGAIAIIFIAGYLIVELFSITGSTMDIKNEAAHRTDRTFLESQE